MSSQDLIEPKYLSYRAQGMPRISMMPLWSDLLALCWPEFRDFRLCPGWRSPNAVQTTMSITGLLQLATHCPHLDTLSVPLADIDMSSIPRTFIGGQVHVTLPPSVPCISAVHCWGHARMLRWLKCCQRTSQACPKGFVVNVAVLERARWQGVPRPQVRRQEKNWRERITGAGGTGYIRKDILHDRFLDFPDRGLHEDLGPANFCSIPHFEGVHALVGRSIDSHVNTPTVNGRTVQRNDFRAQKRHSDARVRHARNRSCAQHRP
ncbi:hypothetical protein C8Q80DRAFT_161602 [Daedaleopsis nitida]|nr:hypothetical protein C8Q80DRAFT_161602 [Daedaleopsis nitida]